MGSECAPDFKIDFNKLDLPRIDTSQLDFCFSEEEVRKVIFRILIDRAPGPDGFNGLFFQSAYVCLFMYSGRWTTVVSISLTKHILYYSKRRGGGANDISDYRPISLIHSFAKLFIKALATRLAPLMHLLVKPNQSAFIRGHMLHENYKAVQLSVKLLHCTKKSSALLKIDIAKAFDTINWLFLF